jgi:hypothetical protein
MYSCVKCSFSDAAGGFFVYKDYAEYGVPINKRPSLAVICIACVLQMIAKPDDPKCECGRFSKAGLEFCDLCLDERPERDYFDWHDFKGILKDVAKKPEDV